jgi:hypothetical protein
MPVDVSAVNAPSPSYVTVMSTGFHSFRDSSQGISKLMIYRLSLPDKKSCGGKRTERGNFLTDYSRFVFGFFLERSHDRFRSRNFFPRYRSKNFFS